MIGVALSGGGTKGAFQAGVISKLTEQPSFVVGTSIGAINAAVWNYKGKEYLRNQWFSTKRRSQWLNLNWKSFFLDGLYSTGPILKKISEMCSTGNARFLSEAVRVHIQKGDIEYVSNLSKEYSNAVIDSSIVPIAMKPRGEFWDGGVREKTPIERLVKVHKCSKIIVICNNPFRQNPEESKIPKNLIEQAIRVSDIITHEMALDDVRKFCGDNVQLEFYAPKDYLYDTFCFDNDKLIEAFKMGERAEKLSYEDVLGLICR